ncbi:hypothetical protein VNO80_04655 [Phaseolus coccineus]|uniref:Uncharacterized protein n=1 Tax=Phaseolus coccineus TaxID=3886 RepID=A0AAN9NTT5_PHACN
MGPSGRVLRIFTSFELQFRIRDTLPRWLITHEMITSPLITSPSLSHSLSLPLRLLISAAFQTLEFLELGASVIFKSH